MKGNNFWNSKLHHFIWQLMVISVTCTFSWLNHFWTWVFYALPPLITFVNQSLIRIGRHSLPVLKAFMPEMSIEGFKTFFTNQYHRFQVIRSLWWTLYRTLTFGLLRLAKNPSKNASMWAILTTWTLFKMTVNAHMKVLKLFIKMAWLIVQDKSSVSPGTTKRWSSSSWALKMPLQVVWASLPTLWTWIILRLKLSGASVAIFMDNVEHLDKVLRSNIVKSHPRSGKPWTKVFTVVDRVYSLKGSNARFPW